MSKSKNGGPPSALPRGNQGRWRPVVFTSLFKSETGSKTRLELELDIGPELKLTSKQEIVHQNQIELHSMELPISIRCCVAGISVVRPVPSLQDKRPCAHQTFFPSWCIGKCLIQHVDALVHEYVAVDLIRHLAPQLEH
jgi:hypothetical protein